MNHCTAESSEDSRFARLDWILLVLSLAALSINGYLLFKHAASGVSDIAGCGGGPCAELLTSRWSRILLIPVTAFGVAAYGVMIASLYPKFRSFQPLVASVIAGAAVWFVFLQAVVLRKFCPWCMAAHMIGMLLCVMACFRMSRFSGWKRVLKTAMVTVVCSFSGIALLQLSGPVPKSHRLENEVLAHASAPVHSRGGGRKVAFDRGRKSYDVAALPHLGPSTAERVMVEYFDYQCAACRRMSGFLDALLERHPRDLAVILLPVPLDRACNPDVPLEGEHPGSCEIARAALAVWRSAPASFPVFHRKLMADPSPANAVRFALEHVTQQQLDASGKDPWMDELIQANRVDWRVFSSTTDKLPKLLIRDSRILHGLPSGEEDFIRVMEKELNLPR